MIAHLLIIIFNVFSSFSTCSIIDKAFLSLSWVKKQKFLLVYMYGKEIREGNKKEKGNKRGNEREREWKREERKYEREMRGK